MNDQQDEGRIDTSRAGGISEFARQEEGADEARVQGALAEMASSPPSAAWCLEALMRARRVAIQETHDTSCVTGDERQYEPLPDLPENLQGISEFASREEAAECYTNREAREANARRQFSPPQNELTIMDEAEDIPADLIAQMNTPVVSGTKDTNPKDGVGSLKPSYTNVPVPVLYELGAALAEGARKYGGYNWRVAGVRTSVYIDATRRHLDSFWEGEDIDPDSGLSHITKAIASLTVFRDAQIQGMVENDDRPPSTQAPFMAEGRERMVALHQRYPSPVPNYTEAQVAHTRTVPVSIYGGQTLGYDIEVMLPSPDSLDGFVWAQQGARRADVDQALAVAQALRDDGYARRVVRIMRAMHKIEQMADSQEFIVGEMREPFATVFPGDLSLTAMTDDEAEEQAALEAALEAELEAVDPETGEVEA
jgi:hypothetical protein